MGGAVLVGGDAVHAEVVPTRRGDTLDQDVQERRNWSLEKKLLLLVEEAMTRKERSMSGGEIRFIKYAWKSPLSAEMKVQPQKKKDPLVKHVYRSSHLVFFFHCLWELERV